MFTLCGYQIDNQRYKYENNIYEDDNLNVANIFKDPSKKIVILTKILDEK
jgi:hypothetical protein